MSERKYTVEIKLTANEIGELVNALPLNEQLKIAKDIAMQLSEKNRTMAEGLREFINE
jgi:hypothetical protein